MEVGNIQNTNEIGKALVELSIRLKDEVGKTKSMPQIIEDLSEKWDDMNLESKEYISDIIAGEEYVHCGDCKFSNVIRSDYDHVLCDKGHHATIYNKQHCSEFALKEVNENCESCKFLDIIYCNDGATGITNYTCEIKYGKHSLVRCEKYCRMLYKEI